MHIPSNEWQYLKIATVGGLCGGLSHAAVTPIDVIKTKMQLNLWSGVGRDGFRLTGFTPTLNGYFAMGFVKFGMICYLKDELKMNGFAAIFLSQIAADAVLCPFEAKRIRLVAGYFGNPYPYKAFSALLLKNITFSSVKFKTFELLRINYLKSIGNYGTNKNSLSKAENVRMSFQCGFIAGIVASLVTQPADMLVTRMNTSTKETTMWQHIRQIGFFNLYRGAGVRCVMTGIITSIQFFSFTYLYNAWNLAKPK